MAVQLRTAQMRLTELERGTSETMTSQQSQIDSLGLYIEGVRDEMQEGLEEHQAQLAVNRNSSTHRRTSRATR